MIQKGNNRVFLEKASYNWSDDSIRLTVTPARSTPSIYFQVQEVGAFRTTPGYFAERENLNSFLIVYTLGGEGRLAYLGEEYSLREGQCFFLRCTEHHLYETAGQHWDFLWLHFHGANALGYYNEFVQNGFQVVNIRERKGFAGNLRQILSIYQKRDFGTEIRGTALISCLLAELLIDASAADLPSALVPPVIRGVMKMIDNRFAEPLSLDRLAEAFSVSKYYLAREFKRCTGTPVGEYIIGRRISQAKDLLRYSHLPVCEVAAEVGVPNVSHFIGLFREREGRTPLAYRKAWASTEG